MGCEDDPPAVRADVRWSEFDRPGTDAFLQESGSSGFPAEPCHTIPSARKIFSVLGVKRSGSSTKSLSSSIS